MWGIMPHIIILYSVIPKIFNNCNPYNKGSMLLRIFDNGIASSNGITIIPSNGVDILIAG